MTPEQEALYALHSNVPRGELSKAGQREYDRRRPAWERGETWPSVGEVEAARLAWEGSRARGAEQPVSGDEVRNVRFPREPGYAASQVKKLLERIAAEIDAGRPARPLIDSAAFQHEWWRYASYATGPVDWFLEQLRRREDRAELARINADPWHDLSAEDYSITPFRSSWRVVSAKVPQQEYEQAWRAFGQAPGTHLLWVRISDQRHQLRTAEQQTVVAVRADRLRTLSVGGRTFTREPVRRSSWPSIAGTISSGKPGDRGEPPPAHMQRYGQVAAGFPAFLMQLLDEAGTPILYTGGGTSGYSGGYVKFPGRRWLRFPVRGPERATAIMTAIDQAGNQVARYRLVSPGRAPDVQIIVHPGQELTDELALAIELSAPWLSSRFDSPG